MSTIRVVLVTKSWNGKMSVKFKKYAATRIEGEAYKAQLLSKCYGKKPDYRVLGPIQYKKLTAEVASIRAGRKAAGAKKAAATRAKNASKPRNFICCPQCQAKSKKMFSDFGGLQTRQCQNGHTFEFDKWIADRAFWSFIK